MPGGTATANRTQQVNEEQRQQQTDEQTNGQTDRPTTIGTIAK